MLYNFCVFVKAKESLNTENSSQGLYFNFDTIWNILWLVWDYPFILCFQ